MIEVEKNFDLEPGDKERLIKDAVFISRTSFTDVYYDNARYELTAKDFWLRTRDGKFELKVPMNIAGADRATTDQYRELETDKEIGTELGLDGANLREAVRTAGYAPCVTITTIREQYRKGDFNLDFDAVSALNFATFEAELMVPTEADIQDAEARIMEFARQHGLSRPGRGKVIEYLLKHNPDHYRALKEAGVIRD